MLVGLVKIMLFIGFLGTSVFSFQAYDRYDEAKKGNPNISLFDVIKDEGEAWVSKAKRVARLEKEAKSSIKIIAVGQVKRALKMYYLDKNKYPATISELKGEYLEEDTQIIQDPTFRYFKTYSGYKINITLDNGEKYQITDTLK
ncbi:hypothetical protein ISS03_04985 [Patescibacteria group bacterium]|nr:hypothetical protein [Patescibacteria group bacterium]